MKHFSRATLVLSTWRLLLPLVLIAAVISYGYETKWIAIGSLHNWYASLGSEVEVGRTGATSDQLDGMRWPAQYKWQDVQAAKGLWIGVTDYQDPLVGQKYNYKVVHAGPRVSNETEEFMPVDFKLYGRYEHPAVVVGGIPATNLAYMDLLDATDPNLPADRMIDNTVNTGVGITMNRKIYAFSQQNHDNYFIHEYTFVNTGIVDQAGTNHDQALTGVVFFFQYRWAVSREGSVYGYKWLPQSAVWGKNTMNDVTGENPASGELRALISWHGLHSEAEFNDAAYDNIGAPNVIGDGKLGASSFVGVVTIHADTSPTDRSDDPSQPTTTYYLDSDAGITRGNDHLNAVQMAEEYAAMTAGHPPLSHAEAVGDGDADRFQGTGGGFSQTQGFGPYTMALGDTIRIVLAEAVAGINRDLQYEVGKNWKDDAKPFTLPDGTSTDDRDVYKNAWVFTGRDSLVQTFERAINNYQSNFEIPQEPPPPDYFELAGGGDRITLTWSSNAELWPQFAGYRILRAIHMPDTTYDEIFACGPGTNHPEIVNVFEDKSAQRGFDYYYYIEAFDDGSTNDVSPGTALRSSKYYTMTNEPAVLKRRPGTALDQIRVVPNPFNIKSSQFGEGGRNRINFFNIPPYCRIRIFTERGDLIQTIDHTDGSGDEAWEQVTSSRQLVVSGVYIALFEVTQTYPDEGEPLFSAGETAVRKFIIIR